jgi:thiamine monophosphate kinase
MLRALRAAAGLLGRLGDDAVVILETSDRILAVTTDLTCDSQDCTVEEE